MLIDILCQLVHAMIHVQACSRFITLLVIKEAT